MGPVVVFAASNFPFAFSVAGGDTASAVAAGCPVILKAHSGHPALSAATGRYVVDALRSVGAPDGVFSVIHGTDAGRTALTDPRVKAGAFTGSIHGGRALFDLAAARPEPIPFYGELGSVNPAFVTKSAAAKRTTDIVEGFVASFTTGTGQLCTKPGILFIPEHSPMQDLLSKQPMPSTSKMLNERIHRGYVESIQDIRKHPAVSPVFLSAAPIQNPPTPTLLRVDIDEVLQDPRGLIKEAFGPFALIVTYRDESQLVDVAELLDGQLTATIMAEDDDDVAVLVEQLSKKAGRLLWNQWPTGVSVTYAQQHGGPYPASTAPTSTSVGTSAIERFLRPVAFQGFPAHLLPPQLQEDNPLYIPRKVDGQIR